MRTNFLNGTAIALGLLLSACGSNSSTENAQNAMAGEDMNAMMADPANPFAQAEMQMHERMMAAQGANASETWVRKMIEHHQGAIAMNDILISQGGEAATVAKARQTSEDQRREVQQLQRMVQAGGIGAGTSGNANPYGQSERTMHDRMMAAKGTSLSETWTRKMIEHHRGAGEMSNILIQQGGDPKVLELARMTAEKQQKEIEALEQMLLPALATSASATEAPAAVQKAPPKAEARVSAKREPTAAPPAPKAPPAAQPKPDTKPPAPATTCTPEHRALGHC